VLELEAGLGADGGNKPFRVQAVGRHGIGEWDESADHHSAWKKLSRLHGGPILPQSRPDRNFARSSV
jgi:hypothetical protein